MNNNIMNSKKQILSAHLDELIEGGIRLFFLKRLPNAVRQGGAVQPWPRINIILSGTFEAEMTLGGTPATVKVESGQAMIVPAFAYSRPTLRFSCGFISLVLRENYLRLVYHEFDAGRKNNWPPMIEYHLEDTLSVSTIHAFNSLIHLDGAPVADEVRRESCRLLLKLVRADLEASEEGCRDRAYNTFLRAVRYIEDHYDQNLTRAGIGRALNLSESYFTKLFRRYASTSMLEFQMGLRMRRGGQLLEESSLSVSEIAYACGFRSASFFIRNFKARFSVTPGRYWAQLNAARNECRRYTQSLQPISSFHPN